MRKLLLALTFVFLSVIVSAQTAPALERTISINVTNQPISAVLTKIAEEGKFTFSYNPTFINSTKTVTVKATNKSVREVLALVLADDVAYKSSGKYVILNKQEVSAKKVKVSGYVYDKNSGKKLPNTSVYDEKTMTSSISDEYGYYELEIPKKKTDKIELNVNKQSYSDTSVSVTLDKNQMVQLNIEPAPGVVDTAKNPFKEAGAKFLQGAKAFLNTVNIKDTINRRFQLSFLPYMGTNHKLSANVINRVSINVLGGYSLGNKGVELGGIFNLNRADVSGFQAGGIFNNVGGNFRGFQAGGIFNNTFHSFQGFQAGGIYNFVGDTMRGFQAGGIINYTNGPAYGFKAAGITNINGGASTGFNAAGICNINAVSMAGVTAAGLFNYAHAHRNGAQIAGLFNYADNISGAAQIAGLCNIAFRKSGGVQIAGLFNYATHATGIQIAPFNFSDTCSGVPISVLSVVRKGVHQIEFNADELLFAGATFRTGVKGFHNILGASISMLDTQSPLWSFTYGLGTSIRMGKRSNFDIDLTYTHISKGGFNTNVNFLNRLYLGPEFAVTKWFKIAVGPTVNLFLSDSTQPDYASTFSTLAPYSFSDYTATSNNVNIKWWVGGKVALRFF